MHKNFVHFKYSLQVNKKSILGEYLHSLSQVRGTIYTSRMSKLVSKRLVSKQLCIEMTGNLPPPPRFPVVVGYSTIIIHCLFSAISVFTLGAFLDVVA